jgi:hypothetical protein
VSGGLRLAGVGADRIELARSAPRLDLQCEDMEAKPKTRPRRPWTPEEIARNERAQQIRVERDRERTTGERLEQTLRLSRFMSELGQGARGDVRAR